MKNLFFAGADLVIETADGEINYRKGDFVDIRVTEDGTPFIVKHEVTTHTESEGDECISPDGKKGRVKEVNGHKMCVIENGSVMFSDYKGLTEKITAKIATFESREVLNTVLQNLIMSEELDDKTDLQSIDVSDLVIGEGLSIGSLSRYVAESRNAEVGSPDTFQEAVTAMTNIDGSSIKVPVFRRIKKESLVNKTNALRENLSKPRATGEVSESRVVSVGYDKDTSIDMNGYLVATESLKSAVSAYVSKPVVESVYKTTEGIDPETAVFTEDYEVKNDKGEVVEDASEGAVCYTSEGKIGKLAFVDGNLVCVMTEQPAQGHTPGNGAPHDPNYNDSDENH